MSAMMPCLFLESLHEYNPTVICASFFINPAIALLDSYRHKPFPCSVSYEDIDSPTLARTTGEITVEFDWLAETFPACHRLFQTLQRESIVEYAAIALAFLLMTNLVQKEIVEVSLRGSRADYFVDQRNYMLEISGTESAAHLTSRHTEKVRQLLANPFGRDGYVFVCCFSNQRAKLSFHRLESA